MENNTTTPNAPVHELYVLLLQTPFITATDMNSFSDHERSLTSDISNKDMGSISYKVRNLSKRNVTNMHEFSTIVAFKGKKYDVRVLALNKRNAMRKIATKMEYVKNMYERR